MDRGASGQVKQFLKKRWTGGDFLKTNFCGDGKIQLEMEVARP